MSRDPETAYKTQCITCTREENHCRCHSKLSRNHRNHHGTTVRVMVKRGRGEELHYLEPSRNHWNHARNHADLG